MSSLGSHVTQAVVSFLNYAIYHLRMFFCPFFWGGIIFLFVEIPLFVVCIRLLPSGSHLVRLANLLALAAPCVKITGATRTGMVWYGMVCAAPAKHENDGVKLMSMLTSGGIPSTRCPASARQPPRTVSPPSSWGPETARFEPVSGRHRRTNASFSVKPVVSSHILSNTGEKHGDILTS